VALLALTDPGSRLAARSGLLIVEQGGETLHEVRLDDIDEVHVYGGADVTPTARNLLLRRGTDVLFFTGDGRWLGRLLATESPNPIRRLAQLRAFSDPPTALGFARCVVQGKLLNQRHILARVQRDRPSESLAGAVASLRQLAAQTSSAPDLDVLRGIEGYGAATYFRGFAEAIVHPTLRFDGRNRRPPRDPINACLSFGYTLLLARADSAIRKAGLDPTLGALHSPEVGRPSLALDLIEELRPLVVDRLVLRLVNRQQLGPDDFIDPGVEATHLASPEDPSEEPVRAVWLGPLGRAIFLRALAQTWRDTWRTPDGKRHRASSILEQQAYALARFVEDPTTGYQPYRPPG
jgi:CRISPR-associated protein Cas1